MTRRCFSARSPFSPAAALLAFVSTACLAARTRPDVEAELARATGAALALRVEGLPRDEPGLEPRLEPGTADDAALSLADALALALHGAPELQAELARVRAAEAEADQARLLPNPILDVVLRFPASGATQIDAGLSAGLFALLSRPRRAAAAEDELAASAAQALATALDVIAELRTSYAAAQAADELARLARERHARAVRSCDAARARQQAGERSAADTTALEARRVEQEVELATRETERERARLALARRIGRPSGTLAWTLEALTEPPPVEESEEACIARALDTRPELAALRWRLAALGEAAGLARTSVLGESQLGLAYQREDGDTLGPALATPLPLFDAGSARQRKAEAEVLVAQSELVVRERAAIEDVRRARLELAGARQRLARVRDELVVLETHRRDQVEELFRAGQADVTALLLAEEGLAAAEELRVGLVAESASAWARYERARGAGVR
jgi:cobalt-zinc-cadmium efflux system outer membrane protein